MTPEERADVIMKEHLGWFHDAMSSRGADRTYAETKEAIQAAITAAVEAEREACAKECDDYQKEMEAEGSMRQGEIAKNCASIIRARSKGE